jgi:methionyl-tRNA formyltransferase
MNLLFLLNNDIHSALALQLLVPELKKHQVKIFLSEKVGNTNNLPEALRQLKELETKDVAEKFQELSRELNSEISFISRINAPERINKIRAFAPDLIIAIRFGEILKSEVIALPKFGVINLHSGILPNYRGIMATFWVILNGDKEIGTTLHYIEDAAIDRGAIIKISKSAVNFKESFVKNVANLYSQGCKDIAEFLQNLADGKKIVVIPKENLVKGTYYSYPSAADLNNFQKILTLF